MAYNMIENLKNRSNNLLKAARTAATHARTRQNLSKTLTKSPVYRTTEKTSSQDDGTGHYKVRAEMNNMGLDNSKIGWQDGYVTYNNIKFKPSYIKDDISYAPKKDIQNFVNEVYKTEGKNPVRITDYAAPAGMRGISYSDNEMVSAGGENIPVLYMDGDRAVVDSNVLDTAYEKAGKRLGISSADEQYDTWKKQYKNSLKNAYQSMADYKEWKYNPYQDAAYKAYSAMYQREGERAYRDAAAKIASRNNGNMTSAAQSLANQQLNYYMNQLADRIPELEKNSYERYKNGFDMQKQKYDSLLKEAESAWKIENDRNSIAKADYADWLNSEEKRTEKAKEDITAQLENEEKRISNTGKKREAELKEYDNAWNNASQRGYFTDEEAELLNIPKNENGEYITPNDIKIGNDIKYFNEVSAPQIAYETGLETDKKLKEFGQKIDYYNQKAEKNFEYNKRLAAYRASLKNK